MYCIIIIWRTYLTGVENTVYKCIFLKAIFMISMFYCFTIFRVIALLCFLLNSNKIILISATIKYIVWYFPLFYSIYLSLEIITFGNRIATKTWKCQNKRAIFHKLQIASSCKSLSSDKPSLWCHSSDSCYSCSCKSLKAVCCYHMESQSASCLARKITYSLPISDSLT